MRVDWHGYALDQVEAWADRVVEAAYVHGFRYVEFVHGAADVRARGSPTLGGEADRGSIKQLLRRRLFGGRWHRVEEGSMLIALADNPEPDPSAPWPLLPPPAHG